MKRPMAFRKISFMLCALPLVASAGTYHWVQKTPSLPSGRNRCLMVFDNARNRVVLFGGSNPSYVPFRDTWEWDGSKWQLMSDTGPPARRDYMMAYDEKRGETVVFGGYTRNSTGQHVMLEDTWVWNGVLWREVNSPVHPSARASGAMTFDAKRGVCVLFGGLTPHESQLNDTWIFDGATWSLRSVAAPPSSRCYHALAYDRARGLAVMFGGYLNPGGFSNQTWLWNGTAWIQQSGYAPPGRSMPAMMFNNSIGSVVMYAGNAGSDDPTMWRLTPTGWTSYASLPTDYQPMFPAAAYDSKRREIISFGDLDDYGGVGAHRETWSFDGSWHARAGRSIPTAYPACAYDPVRNRLVAFGSAVGPFGTFAETWLWNGLAWSKAAPSWSPPPRRFGAMAFDADRNLCVLFGGGEGWYPLNDLWEWNGNTWNYRGTRGARRTAHSAIFDASRHTTVIAGGWDSEWYEANYNVLEWDGDGWTQTTHTDPFPRLDFGFADAPGETALLFGGSTMTTGSVLSDTWSWNGVTWTQVSTSGPSARNSPAMALDSVTGNVLLYGGRDGVDWLNDLWVWDGTTWHQEVLGVKPHAGAGQRLIYDSQRSSFWLYNSAGDYSIWELVRD